MNLVLKGLAPRIDFSDPVLNLTSAQAEAMDRTVERMVSAGAGSGKTWTLSLRYTSLLLNQAWQAATQGKNASIDAVLVLTFTDKAAQEMAQRCYTQLLNLLEAVQRQQPEIAEKWGVEAANRLRVQLSGLGDQFDHARIGTFHGFCSHLLRENGLQIGLNPNFRLLDDLESQAIAREAVESAYSPWREEVSEEGFNVLRRCFNGRSGLEDAVLRFLRNRSKFEDVPLGEHKPGALLKALHAESPLGTTELRNWIDKTGLPTLRSLNDLLLPADPPFRTKVIVPAIQGAEAKDQGPLEVNQAYADLLQSLCSVEKVRTLTHASVLGAKKLWQGCTEPGVYERVKAQLQDHQSAMADWPALLEESMALPKPTDRLADTLQAALSSLFQHTLCALEALHKQRNVLDFDGLQIQSLRLLRQEQALCDALYERHRFIMVDEFQDTDAIQWEILRRVGRPKGTAGDHLFAVGDLKQAIYSFRGGDVSVFSEARKALGTETALDRNFRSRHELVHFTNALFSATMGLETENRPGWEAHYSPVEAGRASTAPGEIRLVAYSRTRAKENASEEGRLTALLCQQLLDPEGPYGDEAYADPGVHPEPPIAILLRRRTHFSRTQAALVAAGIPFQVAKGVGFWERPEILDLLHGLHAGLLGDPIATVGFLRSPLACATDPEIQALASGKWGQKGLNAFLQRDLPPDCPASIRVAQATLVNVQKAGTFFTLREICESLIQESTAYRAWALAGDAEAAKTNIQKLLNWMSQIEQRGWSHSRSLRFFGDQIRAARREPEADCNTGKSRVVLQTVHSAKGLEFPVVILGGLEAQRDPPSTLQIGPSPAGWAVATQTPDPHAAIQKRIHNVRSRQIQKRRLLEKEAEDLRLFYVAVTRAEDHLFFIGDPEKPERGSWMKHLATCEDHLQDMPLAAAGAEETVLSPLAASKDDSPGQYQGLGEKPPSALSASGLRQHRICPARWGLSQSLPAVARFQNKAESTGEAAALRGTVLHALLERKVLCAKKGAQAWKAATAGSGWPRAIVDQQGDRLTQDLERMARDPSLGKMLNGQSIAEASFQIPFHGLVLKGQIDLLWREKDQWVLTDFKSGRMNSGPESLNQHKAQLTAYAWAASRLLGTPVTRTEIYSTREAQRMPLPELTTNDFQRHEAHLKAISVDLAMPLHALTQRVLGEDTERPCGDCRFFGNACAGRNPS